MSLIPEFQSWPQFRRACSRLLVSESFFLRLYAWMTVSLSLPLPVGLSPPVFSSTGFLRICLFLSYTLSVSRSFLVSGALSP